MIEQLILKNRSYRRFDNSHEISCMELYSLINLARLSASAKNLQPLKYAISNEPQKNSIIFETLGWAGYLTDWNGPDAKEQPSAYIIMLGDKSISENFYCDHGIAAQSILLGAVAKGLGGCIIASIQRNKLRTELKIADQYEILQIIALGKPIEEIVIEEISENESIKYHRDSKMVHYVPKRKLNDIILEL